MDVNQSASRDARRYLAERVRNDWTFPPAPSAATTTAAADENNAANDKDADDDDGSSEDELRGVTEFRERYYGSTDDDNDDDDDDDEPSDEGGHDDEGGGEEGATEYKFDSPEHVGRSLEERAQRRRRRRRRALEEEMRWNEGVAVFVRRRDAWTGAASVRKYARRRSRTSSEMMPQEVEARTEVVRLLEETAEVVVVDGADAGEAPEGEDGEKNEVEKKAEGRVGRINIDVPASEEPLVPLAPPLLAQNSIRQSITPKAYSDIYAKIVVAGQTPKVPINLSHMTRALVQGWKDDGEWPPRAGPVDPLMGRRKIAAAGGRVGTLAAVLGGGSGDGGAKAGGGHHGGEFLAHHPHLQKGVESVKKVFRLSGGQHGHSNPGGGLVHDGQQPPG